MSELFVIPSHLVSRAIPNWNNNPLNILSTQYQVDTFGQITSDILSLCHKEDGRLFWKVVKQLAFYGVTFTGHLAEHTIVSSPKDAFYIWTKKDEGAEFFEPPIPRNVLSRVKEYGILLCSDASGLPIDSFRKFDEHFPFKAVLEDYGFAVSSYESFLELYNDVSPRENPSAISVQRDDGKLIKFDEKTLIIPPEAHGIMLKPEDFPNCPGIISNLVSSGIAKYGDLPSDLLTLVRNVSGVGRTRLRKIFDKIDQIISSGSYVAIIGNQNLQEESGLTTFIYFDHKVRIPESAAAISIEDVFNQNPCSRQVVNSFMEKDMATLSDLPKNLHSLVKENVLKAEVPLLFDTLCEYFNQKENSLQGQVERLLQYIGGLLDDREVISERNLQLLTSKYEMLKQGENPTLQRLADMTGITRERVRQVLKGMWRPVLSRWNNTINRLRDDIELFGGLLPSKMVFSQVVELTNFQHYLVQEVLASCKIFITEDGEYLSTQKNHYGLLCRELKHWFEDVLGDEVVLEDRLISAVERFIGEHGLHVRCVEGFVRLAKCDILMDCPYGYINKKASKNTVALLVLKEFKAGAAIYQDSEVLIRKANQILPGAFDSERGFTASLQRESESAFLWGWGIYVHRDNIKVDAEDIKHVVDWVSNQFEQGIKQISAYAAFIEFHNELENIGVPNEHALYSCLRIFNSDRFFLPKSPKIYPVGQIENLTNGELVEQYLRQGGKSLSYQTLFDEFVRRRGWKEFTLSTTLTNNSGIIRVGHSEYGLLEFYSSISIEDLMPLVVFLKASLNEEVPRVSVRLVFNNKQATCVRLGIEYPELLYNLLEVHFDDLLSFPVFPQVTLKTDLTEGRISNREQVEDYLLSQDTSVFKDELRQEFIERRGWTPSALDNSLSQSFNILPMGRGVNAEYVHRKVIQWTAEKQERLSEWVGTVLEEVSSSSTPYGSVARNLFISNRLPELTKGVYWTEELLKALIDELPFIELIGTRKSLFVPIPNKADIKGDVDFFKYLLCTQFGGATKISTFQQRLAELDYSYRGDIPKQFQEESNDLPYYFVGDEIIMKDL